ncbi:MAG: response regulator transcription factor [Vulcanimicrobiota bacterium]
MKKILVVDDQVEVRDLVEVTLRNESFDIIKSDNGKEAVELAVRECPDLIIMDIMMPGELDGLDATRKIKNNEETKNCKIIMLTAKGQQFDRSRGFEAGADEYFVKPFSPLDLIRKVEEVVEN